MSEEQIIEIIEMLRKIYLDYIDTRQYTYAVDTHDEITRWERELAEKRGLVNSEDLLKKLSFDHDGCLYVKIDNHE